jgi:hypothetical protein
MLKSDLRLCYAMLGEASKLNESYVQLYEIFAQRSGFQRGDLKKHLFGVTQSTFGFRVWFVLRSI